jgi:hypothetical protein
MAEYLAARQEIEGRLQRSQSLTRASAPPALRRLLAAKNMAAYWAKLGAVDRRDIVRIVFPSGIAIKAATPSMFAFDETRIDPIDWRES